MDNIGCTEYNEGTTPVRNLGTYAWLIAAYPLIAIVLYFFYQLCPSVKQVKDSYSRVRSFISMLYGLWKCTANKPVVPVVKSENAEVMSDEAYIDNGVIVIPLTLNGQRGVVRLPYSRRHLSTTRGHKVFLVYPAREDEHGNIKQVRKEITHPPGISYVCHAEELGGDHYVVHDEDGNEVLKDKLPIRHMNRNR